MTIKNNKNYKLLIIVGVLGVIMLVTSVLYFASDIFNKNAYFDAIFILSAAIGSILICIPGLNFYSYIKDEGSFIFIIIIISLAVLVLKLCSNTYIIY